MSRARLTIAAALAVLFAAPLATSAVFADGPTGVNAGGDRVVEQAAAATAAACRRSTPASDAQCAGVPFSPAVSEQAIVNFQGSEVSRALAYQYALGDSLPFGRAPWLGTHNSFNASAQNPTLSELDANQQLSMADQLRISIRSLELDVHWFPSAAGAVPGRGSIDAAKGPVLCHARGEDQAHAGCTTERLLVDGLAEVADWTRAHPGEVVLLYIEDHLSNDTGYGAGADAITRSLGDLLFTPADLPSAVRATTRVKGDCTDLPTQALTRDDVRAAGKQVVVMSSCHAGLGWNTLVFSDAERSTYESGPEGYGEDGSCDPRLAPTAGAPAQFSGDNPRYEDVLLRVFEDSTALSAIEGGKPQRITAGRAAGLARCAVDLVGFDQILPDDGRLAASVWSYAPGQPAVGGCTVERADGRWYAAGCHTRHLVACRTVDGWSVTRPAVPETAASSHCRGGTYDVPRTGHDAALLQRALRAAGAADAWVAAPAA